jgi:RNA-directed DNA polymerase
LLKKLNTFPAMRRAIKAWLKAGVVDGEVFSPTPKGSPQGGVISPLLANVALHGLEYAIRNCYGIREEDKPKLLRYADDLVVLHPDRAVIDRAKEVLEQRLADMGLALKPSKTRIVHTLESLDGQAPGFDFLGFNVRQFPVGKHRSGLARTGKPLGFIALITPSKEAIQRHYGSLRAIVVTGRTLAQAVLIAKLNQVIRGWSQ